MSMRDKWKVEEIETQKRLKRYKKKEKEECEVKKRDR